MAATVDRPSGMYTINQHFQSQMYMPWNNQASQSFAGSGGLSSSIVDYTRPGRYDPTKSGVEGGIFGGCTEVPAAPAAAAAAARVKAAPSGGGYGKADFLDRLALAEQRDAGVNQYASTQMNPSLHNEHSAGMRPNMKPSKEEQFDALTKRQTTLRAAEQRVRENHAESVKNAVHGGLRKQFQMTPNEAAVEQAEREYEAGERQRRQRQIAAERDERITGQLADHQAMRSEEAAARRQRKGMLEARQAAEMREQRQAQERAAYAAQREQQWKPNALQARGGPSPMRAVHQEDDYHVPVRPQPTASSSSGHAPCPRAVRAPG